MKEQGVVTLYRVNTAKAIGHEIKEQAIESRRNLVDDAIMGNDLKEGINREKNCFKIRVTDGIQELVNNRIRKAPKEKYTVN